MTDANTDGLIRLSVFIAVLAMLIWAERSTPRRAWRVGGWDRWLSNLAMVAVGALLIRLVSPITAVGVALIADDRGWGLLHMASGAPAWLAITVSVVALDFAVYLQHRLFHAMPPFWRLHRVHHTDLDVDVTTGVRFHPVELLLSVASKAGAVVVVGAPAVGVVVFEILLNAGSLFSHANLRLPSGVDRAVRWLLVTPDMHRVHHSADPAETGSNFGFTLSWWDRLLRTYRAEPSSGHAAMRLGVDGFDGPAVRRLVPLLIQPFVPNARRGGTQRTSVGTIPGPNR
jgi:sterol desaturase/sphingolipid hydroxylase (fatty acid hydroxylase superfamily)